MGIRVSVGPFRKIAVEGSDNTVACKRIVGLAFPLPDARSAGIGHNQRTGPFQSVYESVPLSSGIYSFTARIYDKLGFWTFALGKIIFRHRGSPRKVLIGRIGAGPYECHLHILRITGFLQSLPHPAHRAGSIRSERSVDIRFQLGKIDFDQTVIVVFRMCNHLCISTQIGRAGICKGGHFASVCGLEIVPHLAVIREDRASSPHFRSHIANSGFSSAGES